MITYMIDIILRVYGENIKNKCTEQFLLCNHLHFLRATNIRISINIRNFTSNILETEQQTPKRN